MSIKEITFNHGYKPRGQFIVYIKSEKEKERARYLVNCVMGAGTKVVDEYIETSTRPSFKPELAKAIERCNDKTYKLIIPNIGHLCRNLTACGHFLKLDDSSDPYVLAITEIKSHAVVFRYRARQMFLQCEDQVKLASVSATAGLHKKMQTIDPQTGKKWEAGNKVNLNYATKKATKARRELADAYASNIIVEIREIQRFGKTTLQQIADALMARGHKTRRGKNTWTPTGVSNILNKAKKLGL